jgi:hypothetical protein
MRIASAERPAKNHTAQDRYQNKSQYTTQCMSVHDGLPLVDEQESTIAKKARVSATTCRMRRLAVGKRIGTSVGSATAHGATLVSVTRSSISQNGTGVLTAISSGGAVIVLNGSAITHNGVAGADTTGGGAIQSLQNNVFQFDNVNVNGALTPLGAL